MKVLAILCLAGLALASRSSSGTSEFYWETSKEYVYEYSGRLLTGIPELSDVYSGVGINCTVHIQRTESDGKFYLSIRNPKYVRVNEKLEPVSPIGAFNWREFRLPELTQVSGDHVSILSRPIRFSMSNGEIHSAEVSKDEPVWSVNFKKALALLFQTKFEVSTLGWEQEQQRSNGRHGESDEHITYWKVKEETIDGVCENIYEVRELPKYMITDRPEMIPYPEACSEEKYFGLTKTKDVGKCEKRSAFNYYAPGHFGYEMTGNNMDMWTRSSNTRYIACGNRGRMTIQTIINDGELNQNLLGFNTERFVTGTMQTLFLKKVGPASSIEMNGETVTIKSFMFEYSRESFINQHSLSNLNVEERLKSTEEGRIPRHLVSNPEVVRQSLPRNFLYGVKSTDVSSEEIKRQVTKYLTEIVRDLTDGTSTKDKMITSKAMAASRGFLLLRSKEEVRSVYEELKREFSSSEENLVSMKNVFFDTLLMSGCPHCIYFIKDCMMAGEMTTFQMSNFFMWLPNYVKVPTEDILNNLYELSTSEKVRSHDMVYNKAIMGFSSLLNRVCLSPYRKTSYPENVFGEFCRPESELITGKWIPYLAHDLKYTTSFTKRNELIIALGLMQHKAVIGELIPFVEGSYEHRNEVTPMNRFLAIHSLANAASSCDPTHVIPMFVSILSNPSESTSIRIAAFNALLRLNPSMAVLQKVAALTWTIHDEELLKVINLAFFTLKMESERTETIETTLTLSKKAFLIFPLIKKTPGILPSSASIFSGDYLKKLGIGYNSRTTWISSKSSFIPKDLYTEINYFLDEYKFTPFAFGLRLSGVENLYHDIEKLFKPIESEFEGGEEMENDYEQVNEQQRVINQEWRKIIRELKLKTKSNVPMDGAFFLRWFESSPLFYNFDKMSVHELRKKLAPFLANPEELKEKMCGTFKLNFQQSLDRAPTSFMVPSDMGFPIVIEAHMPIAFSVRGELNIKCETLIPSITLKTSIVSNAQYSGWVGTTIPFTEEYAVTGVEELLMLNFPAKIELSVDVESGKVSFSFKPEVESTTGPVDLVRFHVRPYSTYKKVSDLTPLTMTPSVVYLHSSQEPRKSERSFGDFFGLSLKYAASTESPYGDFRSCLDVLKLYNYNPANIFRFIWSNPAMTETGKPSLRPHDFTLIYDPTTSSTKEVQFDVKIGYGQKVKNQQNIQYATVQLKNQQNQQQQQQQQQQQLNKLNPFQLNIQDIDSQSVHPRRQQKIKQALQNLNCQSGHAVSIVFTTTLKGSRPRSWSYIMTYAAGKEMHSTSHGLVKSKWDIKLESETSTSTYLPLKEVCIKGEVDMPVLPIWNIEELRSSLIDFRYINEISFGKTSCSESSIKVHGSAKVSQEQKEFSRESVESRKCHKMIEDRVPGAKLSKVCERTRLQASTVDEVEFKMEYSNVPSTVTYVEKKLITYLKTFLWPYIKEASSRQPQQQLMSQEESSSFPVMVRVLFHRETPSFDLVINKPEESIAFSMIRIPYPLNLVFPLKAGRNNAYLALKTVTGGAYTPECKISTEKVVTFDNKSMPIEIDDCFHLLSGDCSSERSFGILARSLRSDKKRREVKVFLGESVLLLTPTERHNDPFQADIRVTVDSEEVTVPANVWKSIYVRGQEIGSIFRSSDNVFQVKSASRYSVNFLFDGSRLVIYASNLLKSKLCGVCGNFNQQSRDDLTGPSKCMHAKPQTLVASFRVPSSQCKPLPHHIVRELEKEQRECIKFKEIPTKVTKSLKAQTGKCTLVRHIVVERPQEVCISKNVVASCQSACKPAEGKMITKNVEFVCMPEGRTADLYVRKANDGQKLPELRNMETAFESKVEQPKRCISSILKV